MGKYYNTYSSFIVGGVIQKRKDVDEATGSSSKSSPSVQRRPPMLIGATMWCVEVGNGGRGWFGVTDSLFPQASSIVILYLAISVSHWPLGYMAEINQLADSQLPKQLNRQKKVGKDSFNSRCRCRHRWGECAQRAPLAAL